MANLSAPLADDVGPGAVLVSAVTQVIASGGAALTAPPETVSPDYGPQIPPASMSFG